METIQESYGLRWLIRNQSINIKNPAPLMEPGFLFLKLKNCFYFVGVRKAYENTSRPDITSD
jgi:hypothetical protein